MIRGILRWLADGLDRMAGPRPAPKQPQQWEPRKEYARPLPPMRARPNVVERPQAELDRALRLMEEQARAIDLERLPKEDKAAEIRRLARSAASQVDNRLGVRRLMSSTRYYSKPAPLSDPALREELRQELENFFRSEDHER